jgi:preprotein translocase subunit SecA
MTGTAVTSSEEFYKVYGLNTVPVPTNKTPSRKDSDDFIFQTEKGKFKAIARRVKELHDAGQPVLVGTASVEKNELLSSYFKQESIPHAMLNAKNHEREGEIIAQAGRKGAVTIATNMAGRGVDISLGGKPSTPEEFEAVRALGGLFVLGTERHEARRIDNQLRGRAGRQGDPGETQFYVSLEDSLMRVFASDTIKRVMGSFGIPEDEPIFNRMITRSLEKAQEKIEDLHFDARKQVLAYDDVMNVQRKAIYDRRRMVLNGDKETIDTELTRIEQMDTTFAEIVVAKKAELGDEAFYPAVRRLILQTIDMLWVDQLETMEHLRSSVGLRAYGQRDPLVEYKREALGLFKVLEAAYAENIAKVLPQIVLSQPVMRVSEPKLVEIQAGAEAVTRAADIGADDAGKYFGRNDKVTITNGTETRELKYKKAEELLATGQWRLVDNG